MTSPAPVTPAAAARRAPVPRVVSPRVVAAFTLVLLALVAFPRSTAAQTACTTPGEEWVIRSFRSDYVVRPNGSVGVTERLEVDFGDSRKHGIHRDIHVRQRRISDAFGGGAQRIDYDLDVRSVVDETGEAYGVKTTREGSRVRIRIGSPDFCVTGPQVYVVHYEIDRGVRSFDGYDELYWQVTGTDWPVPIERAEAHVILPPEAAAAHADSQPWHADCYSGGFASTSSEGCTAEVISPGVYRFATTRTFQPGEGLTFAAAFPVGVVPGPTAAERAWDAFVFWGPLGIPPLALLLLFGLWWRHGKEPEMGSIMPRWEAPENLRPGPAGTLVDQKVDMDDVVATILDLAVRGWIKIREVPPKVLPGLDESSFLGRALGALGVKRNDWELVRLKKDEEMGLLAFEHLVLKALFDGKSTRRLSDLDEEFYSELPEIREAMYDDLVEKGLFPRSPESTRRRWIVGAVLVGVVGAGVGVLGFSVGSPLILPAMLFAAVIALVFAFFMPAMTRRGAKIRAQVEGLEEYVRRAEKAEMEFANAPEKNPELFDRLLPYAVALDVTELWMEQFEGILTRPPDWYDGRVAHWNTAAFASDLSAFRSTAASTLASSPGGSSGGSGSFGGGSVGGGGGGGGGGSW